MATRVDLGVTGASEVGVSRPTTLYGVPGETIAIRLTEDSVVDDHV
jgi:hypothetical protein